MHCCYTAMVWPRVDEGNGEYNQEDDNYVQGKRRRGGPRKDGI